MVLFRGFGETLHLSRIMIFALFCSSMHAAAVISLYLDRREEHICPRPYFGSEYPRPYFESEYSRPYFGSEYPRPYFGSEYQTMPGPR